MFKEGFLVRPFADFPAHPAHFPLRLTTCSRLLKSKSCCLTVVSAYFGLGQLSLSLVSLPPLILLSFSLFCSLFRLGIIKFVHLILRRSIAKKKLAQFQQTSSSSVQDRSAAAQSLKAQIPPSRPKS